eukprot:COSAG01_NODE_5390_length_4291_cov_3.107109_4_plen_189_part_00
MIIATLPAATPRCCHTISQNAPTVVRQSASSALAGATHTYVAAHIFEYMHMSHSYYAHSRAATACLHPFHCPATLHAQLNCVAGWPASAPQHCNRFADCVLRWQGHHDVSNMWAGADAAGHHPAQSQSCQPPRLCQAGLGSAVHALSGAGAHGKPRHARATSAAIRLRIAAAGRVSAARTDILEDPFT